MDIASMLEVEVQEVADSKENVTPVKPSQQSFPCQTYSKEENDFYRLTYGSDVAAVRFLRLHCTGCDEHIGSAPAEAHNMHEHPVLRTLLCAKCREFYGDGTFEQGDDATDMFCRWCANGGNLYCCSYCSNTFCSKCIKRNFDPPTIKRIEAEDSWKCFVCDPKDLYPLRSIARALITHIETVTRILENDRRMTTKEIEEKMHLDETKCCSRKRKRRRRRTLSNSDDDEEEDVSYVPETERPDTPPMKKRKVRRDTVRNVYSNGYQDHEYSFSKRKMVTAKSEPDPDPEDMMLACEQTMIEGDNEIIHTDDAVSKDQSQGSSIAAKDKKSPAIIRQIPSPSSQRQPIPIQPHPQGQLQLQAQQQKQQQQGQKLMLNNSMAINPVPLANLLKVALSSGAKKIKVTHTNQKLVAVPMTVMPKSVASSSVTFVKPPTHFLVPKNVAKNLQQNSRSSQVQPRPAMQQAQPSVIDIDSDDEPVILENNSSTNSNTNTNTNTNTNMNMNDIDYSPPTIVNESAAVEENVIPDQMDYEDEPVYLSTSEPTRTTMNSTRSRLENEHPVITIDGVIPLKLQKRDQRFKKMLILQSQEIDNTVGELKTKILKLIQVAENSKQDVDPLGSATLCTKRFHRALRKTLVELSHINDRVVRDYVHWKKRTPRLLNIKAEKTEEIVIQDESRNRPRRKSKATDDDLTLEMMCVRESASESEDDDDIEELNVEEEHTLEATETPVEFSQILDHLTIFKRKPMALKAVGDSSVLTEDKACQAYDVPWRDYEKCIGYSLVTRAEYDAEAQEVVQRPAVVPDENFGKYQEQFLFYLQHIEDHGIETDELKGLPDPNHIPLKDLIDGSSPFIMDMLERLSPVTLSNGCTSPNRTSDESSSKPDTMNDKPSSPNAMETSTTVESENLPSVTTAEKTSEEQETENKTSEDNVAATSKAVEELVKMVTKLSEDLRSERKETDDEIETIAAVNSILEPGDANNYQNKQQDDEKAASNHATNDECTTID